MYEYSGENKGTSVRHDNESLTEHLISMKEDLGLIASAAIGSLQTCCCEQKS